MARSNHVISKKGPKLYALRQLAYFLQPITARELAIHMDRVVKHGLSSNQIANHLRRQPDVTTSIERPNDCGVITLYGLSSPHEMDLTLGRRKVNKYLMEMLEVE
tara:strand:+ start:26302 stop:26616 length:315 start_codon:yes stop_codon:yes gene_type:complete